MHSSVDLLLAPVLQIESEVSAALASVSELIFFLLGAMTVVEVSIGCFPNCWCVQHVTSIGCCSKEFAMEDTLSRVAGYYNATPAAVAVQT